jgi:hypothetical protein
MIAEFQERSLNDAYKNSVALVRKRTIPTERPPLVGEVSANFGRAIAEAVSRWLPTAAARVQSWVWSSGISGGQSRAGAGFLRVLRFPLPFIHQILHPHNHPGQVH